MKVTFAGAVKSAFVNFAQFRGTSTRPEYWYFVLFSVLMALVLGTIDSVIWPPVQTDDVLEALNQPTPFSNIFAIVLLVPSLAVTSRRMRDAGWSGKWLWSLLLPLIPFIFGVVGVISYLDTVVTPDIEVLVTLISYFVPAILLAFAVQIFLLVLCLRPSKSKEDGNRFAE
ncbi:MAG: hypothetical protein RLZZ41_33 [Actinomycetota bacterium]